MSGYIGNIPTPQATQSRQSFTATSGQTSFATVGYTPGFVDVYVNGVHMLDGSDYNATNGSDVVLTTGAIAGDIVEVISYATFEVNSQTFTGTTTADNLTVTGAFTSQGIDDNADATAITIDSSENVLIGKAALGYNTSAGTELWSNGFSAFTRDNAVVSYFNRKTSDGDLVQFLKDGTQVGSIGVDGGSLVVGGGDVGIGFYQGANALVPYDATANSVRDAAIDLGYPSIYRWKDLYLSGGVYLGGTGAANYLDDYEEGTWTPVSQYGTVSYSSGSNTYTKIGDTVCLRIGGLTFSDITTAASITITGLPFVVAASAMGSLMTRYAGTTTAFVPYISGSELRFYQVSTTGTWYTKQHSEYTSVSNSVYLTITYRTTA